MIASMTDSTASKFVTLRTGDTLPRVIVATVTVALEKFWNAQPHAVPDLIEVARNPNHQLPDDVRRYGLIESNRMHDFTRAVILASVEGGLVLRLVDPITGQSEPYQTVPALATSTTPIQGAGRKTYHDM